MKNILIMRSANMKTMERIIDYLKKYNKNYNIYCLVQKSGIDTFKEKYPHINYIEKKDGFFKYKEFKEDFNLKNKLKNIEFDKLYIPSSYADFPEFQDVFMIASKINSKKYFLFNVNGEIQEYNFNFISLWIDKYLGDIIYLFKVILALIGIAIIYVLYYPYCFFKEKLLSLR